MRTEVKVYRLLRNVIGHSAALWASQFWLAATVAIAGLLLFWIVFSVVPVTKGGKDHQECGAGPLKYDC